MYIKGVKQVQVSPNTILMLSLRVY